MLPTTENLTDLIRKMLAKERENVAPPVPAAPVMTLPVDGVYRCKPGDEWEEYLLFVKGHGYTGREQDENGLNVWAIGPWSIEIDRARAKAKIEALAKLEAARKDD